MLFTSEKWFKLLYEECFRASSESGSNDGARYVQASLAGAGSYDLVESTRYGRLRIWRSLTNHYSQHYGPSSSTSNETTLQSVLTAEHPTCLILDYLQSEAAHTRTLQKALSEAGCFYTVEERYGNWVLPTAATDAMSYLQTRSSRLRNTLSRGERRLQKAGSVSLHLQTQLDENFEAALRDYQHIYALSWKGNESHPDFISGLMRLCAEQKKLLLGVLRLDNKAVAAQLWIVDNNVAYIYKLAYDPDFASMSVGSILTAKMIAAVYDQVELIDYGIGDEAYKADWMTERRQYVRLWIANPYILSGRLLARYWKLNALLRKAGRRVSARSYAPTGA